MINALHPIWIVPTAAMFGFLLAALVGASKR